MSRDTGDRNLLLRQVLAYTPATMLPAAIGLAFSAVFTRLLSPEEFGHYSLTVSIVTLATSVAVQWLQQGVNRYLPAAPDAGEKHCIKHALVVALVLVESILAAVGMGVAVLFRAYAFVLPGIIFAWFSAAFSPVSVVFQAEMKGHRYGVFRVANAVLKFVLSLALVLTFRRHASALIWGEALSIASLMPLMWRTAGLPSPCRVFRPVRPEARRHLKRFADYGVPMAGWFIASNILGVGDRYVIQWFRGPEEVGIYSANYQLVSGAIGLITSPVLLAAHPFLMRSWGSGDARKATHELGRIVELLAIVGSAAVAAVRLFSADLANWFLGSEFRSGHVVMPIVLAGVVIWNMSMYLHKPLEFAEQTLTMMFLGLAAAALNFVLNIIFVPSRGYVAAAWTTVVSYGMYGVAAWLAGLRRVQWHVRWPLLLSAVLLAVGLVIVGENVRSAAADALGYWGGLAATGFVCIVFAVALVALLWKSSLVDNSKPELNS